VWCFLCGKDLFIKYYLDELRLHRIDRHDEYDYEFPFERLRRCGKFKGRSEFCGLRWNKLLVGNMRLERRFVPAVCVLSALLVLVTVGNIEVDIRSSLSLHFPLYALKMCSIKRK
jgi:hypothetical protein